MKNKDIGKILVLAAAMIAGAVLTSCRKTGEDTVNGSVPGVWHMVSHEGITAADADIFLDLRHDGNFSLYQKTGDMIVYDLYTGTYRCPANRISGTYSDGTAWASEYDIAFDGARMTMEAAGSREKSVWEKCPQLPDIETRQRTRSCDVHILPIL